MKRKKYSKELKSKVAIAAIKGSSSFPVDLNDVRFKSTGKQIRKARR